MAHRMPQNAPESAHYKLQLVALKREVDKGKGNSMLYSAYLQVRPFLSCGIPQRETGRHAHHDHAGRLAFISASDKRNCLFPSHACVIDL